MTPWDTASWVLLVGAVVCSLASTILARRTGKLMDLRLTLIGAFLIYNSLVATIMGRANPWDVGAGAFVALCWTVFLAFGLRLTERYRGNGRDQDGSDVTRR